MERQLPRLLQICWPLVDISWCWLAILRTWTGRNHESTGGVVFHFCNEHWQVISAQDFGVVEDVSTSQKRMVMMDGWGGALVTLSSGLGLGLSAYVYMAYVWIAWPPLVEDATIQASADYIRKMFSNMNFQIAVCHVPLCFTLAIYHSTRSSKNPLALWASIFLMYKTVWVEEKTTWHFYAFLTKCLSSTKHHCLQHRLL